MNLLKTYYRLFIISTIIICFSSLNSCYKADQTIAIIKVLDNNTLFDQNMSLGLLKWISGRYRTGIKAFTNSPITLKDIRETEFRIKLGESVGHYIWYVDLLEMALEQVGETLDSVEAAA